MHNMLKGARSLNPDASDEIMTQLGITVLDLIESDELRRALYLRAKATVPAVEVPVLRSRLGPGLSWSDELSQFERVSIPCLAVAHVKQPVVARLSDDRAMAPSIGTGDLVLLDSSEAARRSSDPEALFAVESERGVLIRWIRRGRRGLYLLSAEDRDEPRRWQLLSNSPGSAVLRARAIPVPSLFPQETVYDPFSPPRDTPLEPAPPSDAN